MNRKTHYWIIACALLATPAIAQEQATQIDADQQQADIVQAPAAKIDEVVVTATKRSMDIRDITGSVSALLGDDLEATGAQGQEDFLKLVPGVTFYNDNLTNSRITIRGIGADLNTSNTAGIFIGDVPFEDPTLPRVTLDPNPFDLARVEVLKGPQGTLFGGAALNGAVRYIPQDPAVGEWAAKAYSQHETVNEGETGYSYGGVVNIPVGDNAAIRVLGFNRRSAGWVDDLGRGLKDVNKLEQVGYRAMAKWLPTPQTEVSFMWTHQQTEIEDSAITDNADGNLSRSNTPQSSPVDTEYSLATFGLQYSFSSFDVKSQTTWTEKYYDAFVDISRLGNVPNPPPSLATTADNESESIAQELRFTSTHDGPWTWLVGGFYRKVSMSETLDILASDQALPVPPELLGTLAEVIPGFHGYITEEGKINTARGRTDPSEVTELALFGEVTRSLWERLELTVGLRAFKNKSYSQSYFSGPLTFNNAINNLETETVKGGTLVEQGINPKFAAKFIFNDNISIYAAAARGFRFGGYQVLVGTFTSPAPDLYKSDIIWEYEIGLRTQWLQETLTFDVTPFWIDWTDPQLQQADQSGIGSYFDNVGGARSKGVELAIGYLTPLPGLQISFIGSYVDTVTTEAFIASNGETIAPGTQWPLSAKWQSTTTISYSRNLFRGWVLDGSATYVTISEAPNTLSFLDIVFDYKTLDLQLAIANDEIIARPQLSLTLSNATDERGLISGVNNPQAENDHVYIRPRTLTARLSVAF